MARLILIYEQDFSVNLLTHWWKVFWTGLLILKTNILLQFFYIILAFRHLDGVYTFSYLLT